MSLQKLTVEIAVEIYKVRNGSSQDIINEFFQFQMQNHNNLRTYSTFRRSSFNTTSIGKPRRILLKNDPRIWKQVPEEIKFLESPVSFKETIKK